MTLFLVRHGRAIAGIEQLDPGLDATGASQARHAAQALASSGAGRLVCSPLRRARETATPIAEALGVAPEIRDEIAEVFDPAMDVMARASMLWPLLSGRWSEQRPDLRAYRRSVIDTLLELGADPGTSTVVVSHFVAISVAIGASTGDDRVSPCPLANGSITTLEVAGGKLALRRPGEVAHLPRDEITSTSTALPGRR